MNKLFVWVITFVMVQAMVYGQNQKASAVVDQQKKARTTFTNFDVFSLTTKKSGIQIPKELSDYSILTLNTTKLKSIKGSSPEAMNLTLPGKSPIILELVKVQITTDNFKVVEMPSGKMVAGAMSSVHYRGVVRGKKNSMAAVSILDDEISGVISIDGEDGNRVLGKLEKSADHILYKDKDIAAKNSFSCEYDDLLPKPYTKEQLEHITDEKAPVKCPRIFFDVSKDIVDNKGGTAQAADYITALFNQVAVMYANEDITLKLSGMNVWTSSQPFANNLGSYRSYRNNNSFDGDLAHLVNYSYSGGVAYRPGICGSYNQGISGIRQNFNNVPTYSWSVYVISHELGHNFGAHHTHSCVWNGNNTQIDSCGGSVCGNAPIPSGGGTIMSYCHLKSTGINFTKGFGTQPGNVIRNTVANSNCVQTCDDGGSNCNTGDSVTVTFRNNTDCTIQYFWNNNGNLQSYGQVAAGQSKNQGTFIGHNWIARKVGESSNLDNFSITCGQNTYTTSASCNGGDIVNGGTYFIRTKNNKCITVSQQSSANGANIDQWQCVNQTNQKWRFNAKGQGYYEIRNINSNKCLDVARRSNDNGENIHQWACHNGTNQRFKITSVGGGKFLITAQHSQKCLDVAGGNAANGANIQQWGCWSGNVNQQFTFQATSANTPEELETFDTDQLLVFPNPTNSELHLKIPGSLFFENATIKVYSITGKLLISQNTAEDLTKFNVEKLTNGNYFIKVISGDHQMISRFQKN